MVHKPFLGGFRGCTDRLQLQVQPGIDKDEIYHISFFAFICRFFLEGCLQSASFETPSAFEQHNKEIDVEIAIGTWRRLQVQR